MQAVVRRSKGFSQPTVRLGRLELNLDSREVTIDGRDVHLTGKEYSILELLGSTQRHGPDQGSVPEPSLRRDG